MGFSWICTPIWPKSTVTYASILKWLTILARQNRLQIISNWSTLEDKPLTKESLTKRFANSVSCVRHKGFLPAKECERMVTITHETQIVSIPHRMVQVLFISRYHQGHYNPDLIFPLLSSVGITHFIHRFK